MASYKIAQQRARSLLEMRVVSFARYFLTAEYSKFYGACPKVLGCNSSANFGTASNGKRKYKPGEKLYQAERLVSKHSDHGSNHKQEWAVGSVSYSIALVNFSMPFLQKIIWYFKWQGNLKFVNIIPAAIIFCWAANSKIRRIFFPVTIAMVWT